MIISKQATVTQSYDRYARDLGTAWRDSPESQTVLGQLSVWLNSNLSVLEQRESSLLMRSRIIKPKTEIFVHTGWIPFDKRMLLGLSQKGGTTIIRTPDWLVDVQQIVINKQKFEKGSDFFINGNVIELRHKFNQPLGHGMVGYNIVAKTYEPERFWASILGYSDFNIGSMRFYSAVLNASKVGFTMETFSELVASAVGVNIVKSEGVVLQVIEKDGFSPIVITDVETIIGTPGSIPIVEVGNELFPGDFVFSDVRVWDCNNPPPEFINKLEIPIDYFTFPATASVTISSVPAQIVSTILSNDKLRVRYPIETDDNTADLYWKYQDKAEDASGITLATWLQNREPERVVNFSDYFNWLEILWSAWLKYGSVVTYVASAEPVTPAVQFRLQEIRRSVPPWITHLIQYEEPDKKNVIC